MLETIGDNIKRPGQFRNRPANRRNSRDRLDRVNSLGENGSCSMGSGGGGGGGRGGAVETWGNSGAGAHASGPGGETAAPELYCFSCTEAAQVMSERKRQFPSRYEQPNAPLQNLHTTVWEGALRLLGSWAATISAVNDPLVDAADRPVVYSSSEGGSVWGSTKLPFQVSVSDFLHEMGQAVQQSNTARVPNAKHTGYSKTETAAAGHN